jgi:hypothetical protein
VQRSLDHLFDFTSQIFTRDHPTKDGRLMNAHKTFTNGNKLEIPEELLQFAALPWRRDRQ